MSRRDEPSGIWAYADAVQQTYKTTAYGDSWRSSNVCASQKVTKKL